MFFEAKTSNFEVSTLAGIPIIQIKRTPLDGWGRIVSITSEGGQKVLPGYGVVGPAKAALESITRYLAVELAPKGIVVNGVMAGPCFTRSLAAIPGARELLEETGYTASLIERIGSFYMSPGFCTERMHVFLATGLTSGEARPEEDEEIEVVLDRGVTLAECARQRRAVPDLRLAVRQHRP